MIGSFLLSASQVFERTGGAGYLKSLFSRQVGTLSSGEPISRLAIPRTHLGDEHICLKGHVCPVASTRVGIRVSLAPSVLWLCIVVTLPDRVC